MENIITIRQKRFVRAAKKTVTDRQMSNDVVFIHISRTGWHNGFNNVAGQCKEYVIILFSSPLGTPTIFVVLINQLLLRTLRTALASSFKHPSNLPLYCKTRATRLLLYSQGSKQPEKRDRYYLLCC